jgi:hypothetical protein
MRASILAWSLLALATGSAVAGGIRYVVVTPDTPAEFTLWSSYTASVNCARALLAGRDEREWCEEGVGGIKPKIGGLAHATEVELIDGTECRDMAHVRIMTGPLKDRMGCVVSRALSENKPEAKPQ